MTQAIIHLDRLKRNIAFVRSRIQGQRICLPVKADAYGHGAVPVAAAALAAGVSFLAVARVQEGVALRQAGITAPILLLSPPPFEEIPETVSYRLTPLVSDREFAVRLNAEAERAGIRLPVHLKIDTGMGRVGCRTEESSGLAEYLSSLKYLVYEGTATHLACADSPDPDAVGFTQKQLARFNAALREIERRGLNPGIRHAANSGAVLLHKDAFFDMVRPGILLYGYPPSEALAGAASVEPVMELVTAVVFIKNLKKGETVSYGGVWTAPEDTVIATLPVGYGDGLPRGVSGKHRVIIRGRAYPLVGRICMDQCMANLGPPPLTDVNRGDQALVFGDAAAVAATVQTIPYEITCNINKRVPRIFLS